MYSLTSIVTIIDQRCEDSMKKPRTCSDVRAIAMLSGGLDSTLAAALIKRLGVDVVGLNIEHLFSGSSTHAQRMSAAAKQIDIPVRSIDITDEHLHVIKYPKHGYGSGMNPCIDCRILMLRSARAVMKEEGASFVITGEVLGQRPMSQHKQAMETVARESGLNDRLLRPLSANLLPDTLPVTRGWIDKKDLLSIHGKSRTPQMKLAKELEIDEYPSPAGGCLLTESVYSTRLQDLFDHLGKDAVSVADLEMLKVGRHFRLSDDTKAIVGRDEQENKQLLEIARDHIRIEPMDTVGPTTLVEGQPTTEEIRLASSLTARYSDCEEQSTNTMRVESAKTSDEILVTAMATDDPRISKWRIE